MRKLPSNYVIFVEFSYSFAVKYKMGPMELHRAKLGASGVFYNIYIFFISPLTLPFVMFLAGRDVAR